MKKKKKWKKQRKKINQKKKTKTSESVEAQSLHDKLMELTKLDHSVFLRSEVFPPLFSHSVLLLQFVLLLQLSVL